ncbi:hypothetical protein [Kordiimonas lacus]|uniref:Uncharacterized protein n=1 Tax=Kordiimonas lacus TaxID=637679 RepID=A0A1G6TGE5_9PROT|nr:hypothetical protein [Kordiimonas lacus]SDD28140.1 hypothetical protein SAMN04488071_0228 [Kordiimonas lacus]
MTGKARWLSLCCVTLVAIAVAAPLPAAASTQLTEGQHTGSQTQSMIGVASRCISTMKAYRQAIAFIDKRLQRSPAQVTYELSDGESITLLNRTHTLMRFEKRVLEEGMQARERACTTALLG